MKFIFNGLLMFITIFTVGCTTSQPNPPILNPIPSKKIIIIGVKYPDLNLRFSLSYVTLNKDCRYQPTIVTPLISQSDYEVELVPKDKHQFKVEFYLDKYISGKCKWSPNTLYFSTDEYTKKVFHGGWKPIAYINDSNSQTKSNIKMEYLCRMRKSTKRHSCYIKDRSILKDGWPIVSENGVDIQLSYKFEKVMH